MRVVVISSQKNLPNLFKLINPATEIIALMLVDAPIMRGYPMNLGGKNYSIYSYDYLNEFLDEFKYDYILFNLTPFSGEEGERLALQDIESLGKTDKLFHVGAIGSVLYILYSCVFKYVAPRIEDFRVFITGDSMPWYGADINYFDLPAVNIAYSSQDLYYNYKFSKKLLNIPNSRFKYAVLGIAPWTFNADISIKTEEEYMFLAYYCALKDLHHFRIPGRDIERIFSPVLFNDKDYVLPEDFTASTFYRKYTEKKVTVAERMATRRKFSVWERKAHPKTVKENIGILRKFLKLCEKFSVTPILVRFPVADFFREFFPKRVIEEGDAIIDDMKKEYRFHYLDKSNFEELTYSDFLDGYHINGFGAKKFSKYLNDYIMDLDKTQK